MQLDLLYVVGHIYFALFLLFIFNFFTWTNILVNLFSILLFIYCSDNNICDLKVISSIINS